MICRKCKLEIPGGSVFCCWCGVRQKPTRKVRANGEGTVFMTKNGKWKAEVSVFRNGKRICASKSGFATKKDAAAVLPGLRKKVSDQVEHPNTMTLQELYDIIYDRWIAPLSKDKRSAYHTAWNRLAPIHDVKIRTLRYADLQPLIDSCGDTFYPKVCMKTLLHKLYEQAIKMDCAEKDYSELLDVPPSPANTNGGRTALTADEVHRMWDDYEAGHENTRYFLIMCYTGMRTGELLTIQKQNVRLKEQYCTGGIKTKAGKVRQIVFCNKIMPLVLDSYHAGNTRLCELKEKELYREWHDMAQRIGLSADATPYCCRHTTPTMLAEEGVQPAIIQQIMGHSKYSMTAEHYTHISLDAKIEAVNKLE